MYFLIGRYFVYYNILNIVCFRAYIALKFQPNGSEVSILILFNIINGSIGSYLSHLIFPIDIFIILKQVVLILKDWLYRFTYSFKLNISTFTHVPTFNCYSLFYSLVTVGRSRLSFFYQTAFIHSFYLWPRLGCLGIVYSFWCILIGCLKFIFNNLSFCVAVFIFYLDGKVFI